MDFWCTYPRVYLVDMKDVYTLINPSTADLFWVIFDPQNSSRFIHDETYPVYID